MKYVFLQVCFQEDHLISLSIRFTFTSVAKKGSYAEALPTFLKRNLAMTAQVSFTFGLSRNEQETRRTPKFQNLTFTIKNHFNSLFYREQTK